METISKKSLICKSFMFLMQLKVQQVDSYSTAKCLIAVQCGMIVYGGKFIQINSCVGRNTRNGKYKNFPALFTERQVKPITQTEHVELYEHLSALMETH